MIDGPGAANPSLKVPAPRQGESEEISKQRPVTTQSPVQGPVPTTQSPVGPTGDTFSTGLSTKGLPALESTEQNLLSTESGDGRPTGPRQAAAKDPVLNNCERIAPQEGETWGEVIQRHYGAELSPGLVARIAQANGQRADMRPPKIVAMPDAKDLFYELHPAERGASRKIIHSAKFVLVEPGQSIEDVIKQHYKVKNPKALKGLADATQYLNDASRYGATPSVIALPSLKHLGGLLGRMRAEVEAVEARRSTVDEVAVLPPLPPSAGRKLRDLLTTDKKELYSIPVAGGRYQTEWNDNLGDLSIYVYREALLEEGLTEEEAEHRLQDIMATVARINDLTTVDVGASREIYLPSMREIENFLGDRQVRQATDRFKSPKNQVWNEIRAISQGAQFRAEAIETLVVRESAPDSRERIQGIEKANDVVFDMRVEQAANNASHVGLPQIGAIYGVLMELYDDTREVEPGQLEFRRADETLNDYAQRLFNETLKPRELELFNKHPEMLLAIHLKIMNRNTKWEPGQRQALEVGLTNLGLMDNDGNIQLEQCEDNACVDRKTATVFTQATGLELEYVEGETIDQFFGRAAQLPLTDDQKETLRLVVFFNVMAKKNIAKLEQEGVKPEDIAQQTISLDDVEANMGVRSEEFYGNCGSALSEHERVHLAAVMLADIQDGSIDATEDQTSEGDDRRVNAFRSRFLFEVQKQWGKPLVFDDITDKLFREASLRMMEDMLEDVEAYEAKIHEGVRQCMQLLLSGQPLGAPAAWFA